MLLTTGGIRYKQSRSTNVSLGIAASYSADESYEALKKSDVITL
jgi:hypothetical protein